jgi:hypothetical protein
MAPDDKMFYFTRAGIIRQFIEELLKELKAGRKA